MLGGLYGWISIWNVGGLDLGHGMADLRHRRRNLGASQAGSFCAARRGPRSSGPSAATPGVDLQGVNHVG